jgi:hypothetical protein
MTILAPDVVLNAGDQPPPANIFTLGPARPTLVIETNGRATSVSISSGSVEAQPIDGLGALTGAPSQVVVGTPLALGASARWRLVYDAGLNGASAPLAFT